MRAARASDLARASRPRAHAGDPGWLPYTVWGAREALVRCIRLFDRPAGMMHPLCDKGQPRCAKGIMEDVGKRKPPAELATEAWRAPWPWV